MIPSIANIRKAIYCLNKRLDLLEGGEYSSTITQLSNRIAALESLLDDDLNPTAAIDKFNEIVAELEELEDNVVMTGSYDASVAVGLADNLRGDTIVDAEFYRRKTGGTQSVGSGIAAIKEVRGKSIVWNSLFRINNNAAGTYNGVVVTIDNNRVSIVGTNEGADTTVTISLQSAIITPSHKWLFKMFSSGWRGEVTNVFVSKIGTGANIYLDGYATKTIKTIPSNWSGGTWSIKVPIVSGKTYNFSFIPQIYDLTLMFGAGNEPTVAEFEKLFPLDYYDYNEGEVIPFAGQNLTTTGKNQYNPATGKANLLGGQTYQIGRTYTSAEIDGVAVTLDSNNCFTTTKDCVLDVTGGNDTDTIVAIYNGENVAYEPYEKHTLPLDPSQWRDKQGNLVFPYGGMHGVGTVYDYAKVDADGYIRKVVRCFSSVYLKNLNWNFYPVGQYQPYGEFYASINDIKPSIIGIIGAFRARCNVYQTLSTINVFPSAAAIDKLCYMAMNGGHQGKQVFITDSSYTSVADFVAHFKDDDCLVYQLETPVEIELATPVYAKYLCNKDGTEEITPANGTTPYTTMANLSILYAMDARGEIKNLPKNYLSKESAENMLNAMVSAGVIASYTMTWDAANARYQFTFVKAEEAQTNQVSNESNI